MLFLMEVICMKTEAKLFHVNVLTTAYLFFIQCWNFDFKCDTTDFSSFI